MQHLKADASFTPTASFVANTTVNSAANPVLKLDFPDPFVLRVDSTYYGYATNSIINGVRYFMTGSFAIPSVRPSGPRPNYAPPCPRMSSPRWTGRLCNESPAAWWTPSCGRPRRTCSSPLACARDTRCCSMCCWSTSPGWTEGEEKQEQWRALVPRFEYLLDDLTAEREEALLARPGPPLAQLAWRVLRYIRSWIPKQRRR